MDVEAQLLIFQIPSKESNMAGQMDYGKFIETKSYNIPADAPVGTWKTFIGSAPSNQSWQAPDTGYYNLVGEEQLIQLIALDNTVSYVNLQFKDASGNDYNANTSYGTTDAVMRDISGNDLIKYGDYIMIERDEPTNLPTTATVDTIYMITTIGITILFLIIVVVRFLESGSLLVVLVRDQMALHMWLLVIFFVRVEQERFQR